MASIWSRNGGYGRLTGYSCCSERGSSWRPHAVPKSTLKTHSVHGNRKCSWGCWGRIAVGKAGQLFISCWKNTKFKANTEASVLWTLWRIAELGMLPAALLIEKCGIETWDKIIEGTGLGRLNCWHSPTAEFAVSSYNVRPGMNVTLATESSSRSCEGSIKKGICGSDHLAHQRTIWSVKKALQKSRVWLNPSVQD